MSAALLLLWSPSVACGGLFPPCIFTLSSLCVYWHVSIQISSSSCSVAKPCQILCDSMDCSMPGFPVLRSLPEFAQIHIHWVGILSNHFILCHPLLLLPSIFISINVFFSESALGIRWPKYWSFSFSISPSNEYSRLISSSCKDTNHIRFRITLKMSS